MAMPPNIGGNLVPRYGDWIREKLLGSGAFGTVYLWKNEKTNLEIAIKRLTTPGNIQAMRRWQTEMKLIKDMSHPNIVSFIPIPVELRVEYPELYSLGMDYCSMGDLRRLMGRAEYCCGLAEIHVHDMLSDIGSAIHYIHGQHNMHRDLKPENIVLKPRPNMEGRYLFKITDLGYAKDLDLDISCGISLVGTWHYLAPEFILSQHNLRYYSQVDFWSFGILTFECITGYRPFFNNCEPMQILNLVKEKGDEHICGWFDAKRKKFSSIIPSPHSLNPHFANNLVPWLQLMLRVNGNTRGGKKEEWYKMLENILPRKYIQVVNVANMKMLSFLMDEKTYLHSVQQQIQQETNIPVSEQLLLLQNGEIPNVMQKIADQLRHAETAGLENGMIFLFSTNTDTSRTFTSEIPKEVRDFKRNPTAELSDKEMKRVLQLSLNCVLSKVRLGYFFLGALTSLYESVSRYARNLSGQLQDYVQLYYKVAGMVEFFKESLDKDIAEFESQDNSAGICVNNGFQEQCTRDADIQMWENDLEDGPRFISTVDQTLNDFKKYSNLPNDTRPMIASFHQARQQSVEGYDYIRRELRRREKECLEFPTDKHQAFDSNIKEYRRSSLISFIKDYLDPTVQSLESLLSSRHNYFRSMRFFISHHGKLKELLLSQIPGKFDQLSNIRKNIHEQQMQRQHSIWHMLQYMKDIYNTVNEYEADGQAAADMERENKQMLDVMNNFMEDEDIANLMNFQMFSNPTPPASQPTRSGPSPTHSQISRTDSGTESSPHLEASSNSTAPTATVQNNTVNSHKPDESPSPIHITQHISTPLTPAPVTPKLHSIPANVPTANLNNNNNNLLESDLEISG